MDADEDGLTCVTSEDEFEWSEGILVGQLNNVAGEAAIRNGWTYIGNIASGFDGHGYCADKNWIVRIPQPLCTQLDLSGTLHPTTAGYIYTGERIKEQLWEDLPKNFELYAPMTAGYVASQ